MKKDLDNGMGSGKALFRLIRLLFHYYPVYFPIVIVGIIISSLAGLGASVFLESLIDDYIVPGLTEGLNAVYGGILKTIGIMIVIYVFGIVATIVYSILNAVITQGILKHLRVDMFDKMESLPIKFFDTHSHGDIMSCYTNDTDAIRQLVSQSIPQFCVSLVTVVSLFVFMLYYSVWLSLIVVVFSLAMAIVSKTVGGRSSFYFRKQQDSIGNNEGFVEEMVKGEKVVKVFSHETQAETDYGKYNDNLFHVARKAELFASLLMPIMANLGNIMYVAVAFIGGALAVNNVTNFSLIGIRSLELGVIVVFLTMARQFSVSINQIASQTNSIVMGISGAKRIFGLVDQESEVDNGYVTLAQIKKDDKGNITKTNERTGMWAWKHPHKADGSITYTELKGDIRMFDVDFGYVSGQTILHHVSLYAKPGQKIAFVGATGAGKTTITNLLNRFYDIADGKIRFDGININKIKKADLRRSIGIVLQDTNLFTGTIKDNIRYGRLDATDEEIKEAAKIANADRFINNLPQGYDTMLNEAGTDLSQGERQLLSIARAAVEDPPVLILDEATSSIDSLTEALVQKGMDGLMEGRTTFAIAHRLSTVRNSNAIIVLDHGTIMERGTHEQLLAKKGIYYQLYTGSLELE